MFKKLKIKFLLINMSLLTAVFIGIFGTIYLSTAYSMEKDMRMQLWSNIMIAPQQKPTPKNDRMDMTIKIDLDNTNEVVTVSSKMNTDDLDINNIVTKVINSSKDMDTIKINGESFGYLRQDIGNGKRIVLMSKSFQHEMLWNLLKIFIGVGSLSLILLFFISIYFTNKAINPLEATFRKQKQFIADASHELRTPLTIIKTNVSLLRENEMETIHSQKKWINYIDSQAGRMSTLINEMLSLANLDANKKKEERININLSKMLRDSLLVFEVVIFEKGLILEEDLSDNIFIKGEQNQIKKLISILMDNAIKYTNNNGKITVSLINERNKAKLIIRNTGEGIEKEHLEKIFERFYRVDDSRDRGTGGYGLGLSIAKAIVEEHKGKIHAESIINNETSFIIELPLSVG
ncbi:cell wall metabolism sensor histidine kinase WalK [uncultured Clostridium sp.]|uniref:sensor histidine kinase n=1 Tax=uncultured Clostridium sp. TaxID=59620 RepID=UPI0025E4F29B|nr:ATP-binding protein [uncultured Clostridium sp.]MDU4882637.1 ATP-binding protein [Clostridium celatum]MDU7077353.1 ATP-binding protein [Clostridium celatum]